MNFDTCWYDELSEHVDAPRVSRAHSRPAHRGWRRAHGVQGGERGGGHAGARWDGWVRRGAASAALWFARSASSLQPAPPTLLGMGEEALTRLARDMGQPAYRGKQIHDAIYGMRKASVDDIKQLPESFREQLVSAGLEVGRRAPVEVVSSPDGTRKVLVIGSTAGA